MLDPRQTVYRLDLEEAGFLPPTVILKKQKPEWEEEFSIEKKAYDFLEPIQGTVIPYFYGEAIYDTSPTLVLSDIAGTTLFELARDKFPKDKDNETFYDQVENGLMDAFEALTSFGVKYTDQKLDNFLMVGDGRVMIVDLEMVEFNTTKDWPNCTNCATAGALFREFKRDRKLYTQPPWYAR